jgi:nucleoside-diphosphate-sugar epimerase
LMRATLEGAFAAGVRRLVLLAPVYSYGRPQRPLVDESHPRDPQTFKGRMRKAQEDLVLGAHGDGRIEGTILRVPDFFGPYVEGSLVRDVFAAAVENRRANVLGPIDTPHQFVYVPDLGPFVIALAHEDRAYGRAWNFAGSGTIAQREFARMVFEQAGRAQPKLMVANKAMLRVMGLFDPIMRELVEMNYLQTEPVILDDRALHDLLPALNVTPYAEAIAQTLEVMTAASPTA